MTKRENPVLQLEERIWRKSNGMCTAGSGPYGIGGSSVSKEIGFYLEFTPNPFEDEMKDDDCCSIRVCAFFKDDSLVQRTLIESKDYPALMESESFITKCVANALYELSAETISATKAEGMDAYKTLLDCEMDRVFDSTENENGEPEDNEEESGMEMTL